MIINLTHILTHISTGLFHILQQKRKKKAIFDKNTAINAILVELKGLEPSTPTMPLWCSPS